MTFQEQWLEIAKERNSVLCAGLDPAIFEMGRGDKGLPEGVDKSFWAIDYIEAVAPFCAAIKPNVQYWKNDSDNEALELIYDTANDFGLLVIEDAKLADIGSTDDAGMFYAARRADAVTVAPYAGNIRDAAKLAKQRDIGIITMCLMSNPEYKIEKNKLVPIENKDDYSKEDIIQCDDVHYVKQYIHLAREAQLSGIDGIVIGAPSKNNHILDEEIAKVRSYVDDNMIVLLPGLGAQGGEAEMIWNHFGPYNVACNVGRALMFPKGPQSTPKDWRDIAQQYNNMLNEIRGK